MTPSELVFVLDRKLEGIWGEGVGGRGVEGDLKKKEREMV